MKTSITSLPESGWTPSLPVSVPVLYLSQPPRIRAPTSPQMALTMANWNFPSSWSPLTSDWGGPYLVLPDLVRIPPHDQRSHPIPLEPKWEPRELLDPFQVKL